VTEIINLKSESYGFNFDDMFCDFKILMLVDIFSNDMLLELKHSSSPTYNRISRFLEFLVAQQEFYKLLIFSDKFIGNIRNFSYNPNTEIKGSKIIHLRANRLLDKILNMSYTVTVDIGDVKL
jgi:hypothetical protein